MQTIQTNETVEALKSALNDLLNATQIGNDRMALFTRLRGASAEEREEILARIQSLRERIEDAQLLLKLYIG